ncbi:hypothetical protein [Burkholderia cepacia]|uniref:hypothetical protein n=1 Tax=Burkholderia cepacia TaxID=292 RepID=UPI00158E6B1A|nr:hypothetical protein [Burkholderia cepacia]
MADLRCRAGDLARVVRSKNPALPGRIVVVDRIHNADQWEVTVLGDPVLGVDACNNRPIVTNHYLVPDSSLVPLRGDELIDEEEKPEVIHE